MLGVVVLGAVIGVLVGLTSVGSGSLLTPILSLDYSQFLTGALAVGTATTAGTIMKVVSSIRNYLRRSLQKGYAFMIAITGVPMAVIGAMLTDTIVKWNIFNPLLSSVLIVAALAIIFEIRRGGKDRVYSDPRMTPGLRIKGMAVGAYVGLIAGMTGVATGSLLVASLMIILKFQPRTAATVAIFEGGIILFAAMLVQIYLGNVNWLFVGLLLAGSIPGILIGNHYKDTVNQRFLGYAIAALIIFESARVVLKFLGLDFFIF